MSTGAVPHQEKEAVLRIGVVTIFPDLFTGMADCGIIRQALQRGLLDLRTWNPRDYTRDRYRSVDDRPYGGGPGMVMRAPPLAAALRAARRALSGLVDDSGNAAPGEPRGKAGVLSIYLSPQGRVLDQEGVRELAARGPLLLLCGRYEGVDERLLKQEVDEEWSIGDYVLSGGEPAAMVFIDALTRIWPGVLGNAASHQEDSFADGLLDFPQYTRPEDYEGLLVPPVLLSGDHGRIQHWRLRQALKRTWLRRPELLNERPLATQHRLLLRDLISETTQANGEAAPCEPGDLGKSHE